MWRHVVLEVGFSVLDEALLVCQNTRRHAPKTVKFLTDLRGVFDVGWSDVCSVSRLDVWVIRWLTACLDVKMFWCVCSYLVTMFNLQTKRWLELGWHFDKQVSTDTKLRLHNIISKATLHYGCELWTMNIKVQKQRQAAQMRILRPLLGFTRRHKQRNVEIRIKLNQDNIVDEFRNYQQNCLRHVNKMENKHLIRSSTAVSIPWEKRM